MLNIPVMAKLTFQHHYSVFSVTWSFKNHSNMLILVLKKQIFLYHVFKKKNRK